MRLDELEIGLIHPNADNVRRELGSVSELAASIKSVGVLEPLVVAASEQDSSYTLIAGHRRLEAAKKARLKTVPCRVLDAMTRAEAIELMLVENLQRTDITPIEEAAAYQELLKFDGYDVASIAKTTGRSVKTVRSRVALMQLPAAALDRVHGGQMSLETAQKLAHFADDPAVVEFLAKSTTGMFDYNYQKARARAKAIDEARAAGVEVFTSAEDLGAAHPYLERQPYGTKPAEGLCLLFDMQSGREGWFFKVLDHEPDEDEIDAESERRRLEREEKDNERAAAHEAARLAQRTRLAFVGQQLQEKRLRDAAVLNGLRSVAVTLAPDVQILHILDLPTKSDNWASAEEMAAAQVTIDRLDLQKLVLLLTAARFAELSQQAVRDTQSHWLTAEAVQRGIDWFEFLIAIGYDLNEIDQAKLDELEARLASLSGAK